MLGYSHSKHAYSDYLVFPLRKPTLPAKIIHLRKISQENHVRRMKVAYKRKQMQVPIDDSLNFNSSNTTRNFSCIQTPFTMPNKSSASNEIGHDAFSPHDQRLTYEANRKTFSQKILESDKNAENFAKSRFNKNEHSSNLKNKCIKSDTAIDWHSRKSAISNSNKYGNYQLHTERENNRFGTTLPANEKIQNMWLSPPKIIANRMRSSETKTLESVLDDIESRVLHQKMNTLKNAETLDREIKKGNNCQKDFRSNHNETFDANHKDTKPTIRKISISSKIPISLARLSSLGKNTTNISHMSSSPFKGINRVESSTPNIKKEVKENTLKDISRKHKKSLNVEKGDYLNDCSDEQLIRDFQCITLSSLPQNGKNHIRSNAEDKCQNAMSSVSKWLDSIPNAETNGEGFESPYLASHNKYSSAEIKQTFAGNTSILGVINPPNDAKLELTNEEKYNTKESSSGSEKSSCYYDTETGDEQVTQEGKEEEENENEWEDSDDEYSEECPSDVSHGKAQLSPQRSPASLYRHKVPYYLRNPRWSAKEMNTPIKSYVGMCLSRTPRRKNRMKSSAITPRRKKGKKNQFLRK